MIHIFLINLSVKSCCFLTDDRVVRGWCDILIQVCRPSKIVALSTANRLVIRGNRARSGMCQAKVFNTLIWVRIASSAYTDFFIILHGIFGGFFAPTAATEAKQNLQTEIENLAQYSSLLRHATSI